MRPSIWIGDGVGITKELLVIAVIIVEPDLDDHLIPGSLDHDWLWMHERLVLRESSHILLHPARMLDLHRKRPVLALVDKGKAQRRIDIGEVIEPGNDALRFKLDRLQKDLRVGHEGDQCSRLLFRLNLSDHVEILLGRSPLKRHGVNFSVTGYLDLEPL